MYLVNRSVAIIKPKRPFLDWLNQQTDLGLTLSNIRVDCMAILVPEVEEAEDAIAYIDEIALELFDMELASWELESSHWPQGRTLKMFWEWFDVEVHREMLDSVKGELENRAANIQENQS
jgi:hypothetical protein